ncbi:hypothetical protein BDY21DRAFT_359994 [Lineolata rhizophorae]|uniref:AA1-like domain-containing protein n=1 Tax=Lineolata rhizophorae TaxID=578093 RepID=A0A6A6PDD6_9PEZI|nr:hypothetical protein BDY21DRAFT_359994 [Lineolata rhizophorae]
MRFPGYSIISIAALNSYASAAAMFNASHFDIYELNTQKSNNYSVDFVAHNPDVGAMGAKTTCSASWAVGGDYPSTYHVCADPAWTWKLSWFEDVTSFSLAVAHRWFDTTNTVFSASDPFYVRGIAYGDVNEDIFICDEENDGTTCTLVPNTQLAIPITQRISGSISYMNQVSEV